MTTTLSALSPIGRFATASRLQAPGGRQLWTLQVTARAAALKAGLGCTPPPPSSPARVVSCRTCGGRTAAPAPDVDPVVERLYAGIVGWQRASLAQGITLVESTNALKRRQGQQLLTRVLQHTAEAERDRAEAPLSFRLGLSGAPGAGKSTFIEALGLHLTAKGHRVAVLAVDPSSITSGGSLLGDKTRMPQLSCDSAAYIRPSPTRGTLGGVTRTTSEVIALCEGCGYDVILVETVGVGQSEIAVFNMVDMFCVLVPPAAGDELQGMKKGIMEVADLVIITKADSDLLPAARRAQMEYTSAIKLLRKQSSLWSPKVMRVSSVTKDGLPELWIKMAEYRKIMLEGGELAVKRRNQQRACMWTHVNDRIVDAFRQHPSVARRVIELEQQVGSGELSPFLAADILVGEFLDSTMRI